MGKIFFLMGKSASGKDTIYNRILESRKDLIPYVGFTTRPQRSGEREGIEYHFTDEKQLREFEQSGKLIEKRVYHTVYGDWYYYSVDTDEVDLVHNSYLYIGTLESYKGLKGYYGTEKIVPLYIEVEDGLRLSRALERERMQENPGYKELCRRFLTDSEDFSEEALRDAGIEKRFENIDIEKCLKEIDKTISENI